MTLRKTITTTLQKKKTSDEFLIIGAKANPEAFEPLYEKYYKEIFCFILNKVDDKISAADICSQVFLKALLNIQKFKFKGVPFSAWLYRIAINECNDYFRKSKAKRSIVLDDKFQNELLEEITSYKEDLETKIYKLRSSIQKLKIKDLQIIELRFFDELSFKQIAQIIGVTENNAKVKTYRALDRLKKLMT